MKPGHPLPRLVLATGLAAGLVLAACGDNAPTTTSATTAAATTAPVTTASPTTAFTTSAASTTPSTAAPTTAPPTTAPQPVTITMLTYDAFAEPDSLKDFTARTGITVKIAKGGDTGTLVNKAILTKGNPEGDVLWGLDNTYLSRAVGEQGLFVPYTPSDLGSLAPETTALVPGHEVTPVDTGDVCINYDKAWFTDHKVAPPASMEDLAKPAYKNLLVVENPATSSPGLAFLLASVAKYGPTDYLGWWKQLRANGVRVVDSWDTAYYDEFTQGGGSGKRPLVVSYASSPPATIIYANDPKPTEPTTGNVDSTCFRQVEFAGILQGTKHLAAAQQLIDFLISEQFQADLPLSNFVYPVRTGVTLPDLFQKFGMPSPQPFTLDPADIAKNRDAWINDWTTAVVR